MKTSTAENQAFAERLKQLINEKFDGNMSELAREMTRIKGKDVSPQTVQTWVGDRGSIPRPGTLKILAEALGLNEVQLRYGIKEQLINNLKPTNKTEQNKTLAFDICTLIQTQESPDEPMEIFFKPSIKDGVLIPLAIFEEENVRPELVKVFHNFDDSMSEYINRRDLCAIDTGDTIAKDGFIYAVLFEEEVVFKQIFKETGNKLILHSKNKQYRDRVVDLNNETDFRIIGRQFYRAG